MPVPFSKLLCLREVCVKVIHFIIDLQRIGDRLEYLLICRVAIKK